MIFRALAALSFASLLTLAVATVGIRTTSLRARARIEQMSLAVKARRFEVEHRSRELAASTTTAELSELLRAALLRVHSE